MSDSVFRRLTWRFDPEARATLSRRDLFKAGVAAGAALLLSGGKAAARGARPGRRLADGRVLVIGGGLAGLTAAYELHSEQIEVTVLEATGRLGGRVVTMNDVVPGKVVEGGGELIGSNHPLWLAYADRFGLTMARLDVDEEGATPVVIEGRRLSEDELERVYGEMAGAFMGLNAPAFVVDAEKPWTAERARELDARTMADWLAAQELSDVARKVIRADLTSTNGVTLDRQSYLGFLAMLKGHGLGRFWFETEVYRCRQGNQHLAFRMADAIGRDRIKVGSAVVKVERTATGVRATTRAGEVHEADELVLAIPPSLWGSIQWSPELPEALRNADGTPRVQLGTNLKYLVPVKDAFWKKDRIGPHAQSDGPIGAVWDMTAGQPGEGEAVACFSGGPRARAIADMESREVAPMYAAELRKLLPGIEGSMLRGRLLNWPKMPWARCGYAFPAPGEVTTVGPVLHEGAERLTFAGEHACYGFVGYMEGALQSGLNAARNVLVRAGR
ncbi:MAG: FAD-dependent oxidoreductase [Phycisphaeraceae bacterium]|nr:FAD-dependent oxidoreductase [Phycisphaeraceae bacterium]